MDRYQQFIEHIRRRVRFCSAQQDHAKRRWKAGEIDREEYMRVHRKYQDRIDEINAVCRGFFYDRSLDKKD